METILERTSVRVSVGIWNFEGEYKVTLRLSFWVSRREELFGNFENQGFGEKWEIRDGWNASEFLRSHGCLLQACDFTVRQRASNSLSLSLSFLVQSWQFYRHAGCRAKRPWRKTLTRDFVIQTLVAKLRIWFHSHPFVRCVRIFLNSLDINYNRCPAGHTLDPVHIYQSHIIV